MINTPLYQKSTGCVNPGFAKVELLNKRLRFTLRSGVDLSWFHTNRWRILYAPDFEAAVADTEALLGADHPALARTLGHQGQLLQAMGRYDDAMRVLERSLEIREAAFGPDHPDVAISLNDLGLLHQELGNFPRAQEQFERALGIRERATPPDPRLLANSLSNLAYLLDDRGDFERARTLFDRSLSLKRDFLPADHPSLARGCCCGIWATTGLRAHFSRRP